MPAGEEFLARGELADLQAKRLAWLLEKLVPNNRFYTEKLESAGFSRYELPTFDQLERVPFTTKAELLADQLAHPPYGMNLSYPLGRYRRLHQTSGTAGPPLCWLDTADDWNWMLECWDAILRITGVTENDRLCFPFSFGPFLGFWTAFEAGARMGCFCLPAGGLSSGARLHLLLDHGATVVFCTPTYALRLAEVASEQGLALGKSAVRLLIVAGEPGGSIPAVRQRIEQAWQARVFDHSGLTEVGPMTIECSEAPGGLHILEGQYLVEIIDPETGQLKPPGEVGEMVVTNLGRWGSPVLRYRTGDLVRLDTAPCRCGRSFRRLDGGILGRTDDMIHVRGNNIYPSALENILRRFPQVAEYRIEIDRTGVQVKVTIVVEPVSAAAGQDLAGQVGRVIHDELYFRAEVTVVAPGSLPRFEMKGRRIVQKGI